MVKNPPAMQETQVRSLSRENSLEKGTGSGLWYSCLENSMDYSLLGSSIHGIFQARMLEWVAISFSRGSSRPRDWTWVSCTAGRFFTIWATREAPCITHLLSLSSLISTFHRSILVGCVLHDCPPVHNHTDWSHFKFISCWVLNAAQQLHYLQNLLPFLSS